MQMMMIMPMLLWRQIDDVYGEKGGGSSHPIREFLASITFRRMDEIGGFLFFSISLPFFPFSD